MVILKFHIVVLALMVGLSPVNAWAISTSEETSCVALMRIVPVTEQVPGLYLSLPGAPLVPGNLENVKISPWTIASRYERYTKGEDRSLFSTLVDKKNRAMAASTVTSYLGARGPGIGFRWAAVSFGAKAKITPENPNLTPRGTPPFILLRLQQMKTLGIRPGSLREAWVDSVVNAEAVIDFEYGRRQWVKAHPGEHITPEIAGSLIRHTGLIRSLETILVQSGHKVIRVRLLPTAAFGAPAPINFDDASLISPKVKSSYGSSRLFYILRESFRPIVSQSDFTYMKMIWQARLLSREISYSDPLLVGFHIAFDLEPVR